MTADGIDDRIVDRFCMDAICACACDYTHTHIFDEEIVEEDEKFVTYTTDSNRQSFPFCIVTQCIIIRIVIGKISNRNWDLDANCLRRERERKSDLNDKNDDDDVEYRVCVCVSVWLQTDALLAFLHTKPNLTVAPQSHTSFKPNKLYIKMD